MKDAFKCRRCPHVFVYTEAQNLSYWTQRILNPTSTITRSIITFETKCILCLLWWGRMGNWWGEHVCVWSHKPAFIISSNAGRGSLWKPKIILCGGISKKKKAKMHYFSFACFEMGADGDNCIPSSNEVKLFESCKLEVSSVAQKSLFLMNVLLINFKSLLNFSWYDGRYGNMDVFYWFQNIWITGDL